MREPYVPQLVAHAVCRNVLQSGDRKAVRVFPGSCKRYGQRTGAQERTREEATVQEEVQSGKRGPLRQQKEEDEEDEGEDEDEDEERVSHEADLAMTSSVNTATWRQRR